MRRRRGTWVSAVTAICLAAITGCGSQPGSTTSSAAGWTGVVQTANAEGSVTWWSGATSEPNRILIEAFRKAYPGINVDLVQGTASQLIPRFDQVQQSNVPGPDVFTNYDLVWAADQKSKGNLTKPEGPDIAKFPPDGLTLDGFAVLGTQFAASLSWNPKLVPGGVKTYTDLLDPKFKGHLGILVPGTSPVILSMWEDIDRAAGPGYLQKLAAQGPFHFYQTVGSLCPAIASGEVWAGIANDRSSDLLKQTGAPIAYGYATGTKPEGFVQTELLLKRAPHPNAARVFINFMASREGQIALNGNGAGVSFVPKIPGALPGPQNGTTVMDPTKWTPAYTAKSISNWNTTFHYTG